MLRQVTLRRSCYGSLQQHRHMNMMRFRPKKPRTSPAYALNERLRDYMRRKQPWRLQEGVRPRYREEMPPEIGRKKFHAKPVAMTMRSRVEDLPVEDSEDVERFEKEEFGKRLLELNSVDEKIDLLNPYERDFTHPERRWHRPWHKPLIRQRGHWLLSADSLPYNALPLCLYATKTRLVNSAPEETESPEGMIESLLDELHDRLYLEECRSSGLRDADSLTNVARHAVEMIVDRYKLDVQVDLCPRALQSFWLRRGYRHVYHVPRHSGEREIDWQADEHRYGRVIGDCVQRRGELVYSVRERVGCMVRGGRPMLAVSVWRCLRYALVLG